MKFHCISLVLLIAVVQVYSHSPHPPKPAPDGGLPPPPPPPPTKPISCTRPNEHYECGSACQTTCWNYKAECPIKNIVCNKGCYCNKGTARDATGTCVPISSCLWRSHGVCGVNEEYRRDTYSNNECARSKPQQVVPVWGCFCAGGHKRDHFGNCVPEQDCLKKPEGPAIKAPAALAAPA